MRVTVNPTSQLRRATSFSKEAAIADSAVLFLSSDHASMLRYGC